MGGSGDPRPPPATVPNRTPTCQPATRPVTCTSGAPGEPPSSPGRAPLVGSPPAPREARWATCRREERGRQPRRCGLCGAELCGAELCGAAPAAAPGSGPGHRRAVLRPAVALGRTGPRAASWPAPPRPGPPPPAPPQPQEPRGWRREQGPVPGHKQASQPASQPASQSARSAAPAPLPRGW